MTRRHYGIRVPKARPTSAVQRAGAWSGDAFIWSIVVILIVLGFVLYGVSKTVTDDGQNDGFERTNAPCRTPTAGVGAPAARRLSGPRMVMECAVLVLLRCSGSLAGRGGR